MGKCAGEEFAAISGICIITSYLFLFLAFYFATYKKPVPKGRRRATNGVATGASPNGTPNGRATRSRKA